MEQELKQKQIEEMAKVIHDLILDTPFNGTEASFEKIAEELLKHYQPKIPENVVVLTREEYQMLNYFNHRGEELLKQERKETAEKYAKMLKEKQKPLDEYDEISIGCLFEDIDEILKEITEGGR